MSIRKEFLATTEMAMHREENRKQNVLDLLQEYQRDGYIDNEEGFTFEDIVVLLSKKSFIVGRRGKAGESEDVRRNWQLHNESSDLPVEAEQMGDLNPDSKWPENIERTLEDLVEEGLLEKDGDRYRIPEEKWENLTFPRERIAREKKELGEGREI